MGTDLFISANGGSGMYDPGRSQTSVLGPIKHTKRRKVPDFGVARDPPT